MKRLALGLLLASITGAAFAADLPVRGKAYTKAPAVSPATNWSGFYVGLVGGYSSEAGSGPKIKGGSGGGTVGYNWQFGTFVVGLEGDGTFGDIGATATSGGITTTAKVDSFGDIRGRAGVAVDQVLFFGTAGLAVTETKIRATQAGVTVDDKNTQTGWTAGAGVEWMFVPHWSLKAEYLYRRFDNVTAFGVSTGALAVNSGQVGVNFHF
jgi:outer membrane immunogenic protein